MRRSRESDPYRASASTQAQGAPASSAAAINAQAICGLVAKVAPVARQPWPAWVVGQFESWFACHPDRASPAREAGLPKVDAPNQPSPKRACQVTFTFQPPSRHVWTPLEEQEK